MIPYIPNTCVRERGNLFSRVCVSLCLCVHSCPAGWTFGGPMDHHISEGQGYCQKCTNSSFQPGIRTESPKYKECVAVSIHNCPCVDPIHHRSRQTPDRCLVLPVRWLSDNCQVAVRCPTRPTHQKLSHTHLKVSLMSKNLVCSVT